MSEITEKVLRSGLVDKHTAEMMERFGMLPEGSSEKVGVLAKDQMAKLAEELAETVEREHVLRETALDLGRIRWPTVVAIQNPSEKVSDDMEAVIDRMGRYYFRPNDVDRSWFVPGYRLFRRSRLDAPEMIVEVQDLYVGEQVAAIQVSTVPVK